MKRHALLCGAFLLLALRVVAQPELLPPSALERVPMIITALDPAKPETFARVEEQLVALDRPGLRTVQQLYLMNRTALQEAEQHGRWLEAWGLRARVRVLGQAMVRLQFGVNPLELIKAAAPGEGMPAPVLLRNTDLERAFPRHLIYLVRPLPREEAAPACLFVIARNGAVTRIGTIEELRQFVLANLPALKALATRVKGQPPGDLQDASRNALRTWLTLSQALQGDGFFRFTTLETVTVDEQPGERKTGPILRATGRVKALPDAGNRGEIVVTLEFRSRKYLPADIQETAELHPGLRPDGDIAKLTDPNPAARQLAEENLLRMGPVVIDYLLTCRDTATPKLQAAIDRLCARIAGQK
ncbi:MAG: hypothetical protein ACYDCO_03070 [Armatimonadota bacterium]